VKRGLLQMVAGCGTPRIYVVDGNHANRGELRLAHQHQGMDIQLDWASVTMTNLVHVWGRPVHLDTLVDGKFMRLSCDGTQLTRSDRADTELDDEDTEH